MSATLRFGKLCRLLVLAETEKEFLATARLVTIAYQGISGHLVGLEGHQDLANFICDVHSAVDALDNRPKGEPWHLVVDTFFHDYREDIVNGVHNSDSK
jgi:hypothetical protein